MSLWNELKRRNVFRIAAAYVVIGWLMLQVADIVLGFTGAPEWVGKALIALLVLGFIPVLALAWVFEVGPEGIRVDDGRSQRHAGPQARRLDMVTLGAVVLIVVLMVGQQLGPAMLAPETVEPSRSQAGTDIDSRPATDPHPTLSAPAPEADPWETPAGSIAALPFANRSAVAENRYFVDGIHDELLTELARNANLTVISRTSVMEYAETTKNLREIGRELGVANILEGAVQRAGDQVRITVQLIDAATDAHIWAETYDRQLTPENLFAIQTEIASDIAAALGRQIAPAAEVAGREAPTGNAAAYDLYLQARGRFYDITEPGMRERIELYRRALELDPEFAAAMGELGREYLQIYWHHSRRADDRERGREWIERALELQPDDARLRYARAEYFYRGHLEYAAALEEAERAARGLPGSAEIIALRAFIKRRQGLPLEALELLHKAATLDPRSIEVLGTLVETYWLTGDIARAERWKRRLDAVQNDEQTGWILIGPSARLRLLGRRPAELDEEAPDLVADISSAAFGQDLLDWLILFGEYDRARQVLTELPGEPLTDQFRWSSIELVAARLAHARGDAPASREQAAAALAEIESEIERYPDDYRLHMARARALALLSREQPTRAAIEMALSLPVPRRDALIASELAAQRFFILALIADSEEIAEDVKAYLQRDMRYWGYDGLILDPAFDRHRDHPAFRALEAKYSRKEPGA